MRLAASILVSFALAMICQASVALATKPISLAGFRDGIQHWQNRQDTEGYPQFRDDQVREIADNLLLYQRSNGGWPANFDPTRILNKDDRQEVRRDQSSDDTTFDNRSTYTEVAYLAAAYTQTGDERYRDAAMRGIEFILAAQYENGGWPHSFPSKNNYRPHVTIVDDVMTGVLRTLRDIDAGKDPYEFVDDELRKRVGVALRRGDACLLNLQVIVDGQRTGWAAQYDEESLQPTTGRSFELPALISSESVGVLRYLMSIDDPSPAVCEAIQSGVAWLERSQIQGLRIEKIPAEPVRYTNHTSKHDVIAVQDAAAPPIWARFYEIDTNRPFMANRDGRKVYRLADVARERRTGYSWYSGAPQKLLERDYPKWIAREGRP